jgi:hypothetical protein
MRGYIDAGVQEELRRLRQRGFRGYRYSGVFQERRVVALEHDAAADYAVVYLTKNGTKPIAVEVDVYGAPEFRRFGHKMEELQLERHEVLRSIDGLLQ